MADDDLLFDDIARLASRLGICAAGVMHTPSNLVDHALSILRDHSDSPTYAYPDSGFFEMPNWNFEDVIPPEEFIRFASQWRADGVAAVGGCCGLTLGRIEAISRVVK